MILEVVGIESNFTENDWVELPWDDTNGDRFIGFMNNETDSIIISDLYFHFHTIDDMMQDKRPSAIGKDQAKKLPLDIQESDIKAMIEMALDTKDEEWFEELNLKLRSMKVK